MGKTNTTCQYRGITGFDRFDPQRVRRGDPHPHRDQVAFEKAYKRDSTNQWPENPLVRTSCPPSFVGETSSPFSERWFERFDKMSEKYAKEIILVPKPPEDTATQTGGQEANDGMAQFWKRRLLMDKLAHAPNVDKMMKIMDDMKESEGRALPPSVPDYGLGSSDYFRSQRQLQNAQPRTIKSVFKDTPRSTKCRVQHLHHLKSPSAVRYPTPFKRP